MPTTQEILDAVTPEAVQQASIEQGAPLAETRTRMERTAARQALELATTLEDVKAILAFMNRE